jgi:Na+/proline symporter
MFFTVAIALMGTGYRLRKAGAERNHSSPVDFITDRYQSQILRYTIVFLQILPTLLYLAVHIIAIRRAFNGVIGIGPNNNLPVILITAFLLGSELIGGLSSVAITDTIQGIIMIAAFVFIPIALKLNFGGWVELDPSTYPSPEFYQTPSKDSQWLFWQFSLINVSFLTLPHVMQRVYAARDLKSLKFGYTVVSIAPWLIVSLYSLEHTLLPSWLIRMGLPCEPMTYTLLSCKFYRNREDLPSLLLTWEHLHRLHRLFAVSGTLE